MRTIYIIGIDNDPDGCYITDAFEKPEHTIAGPFHSQQKAIAHAIDAELRVHSRWNEISRARLKPIDGREVRNKP